MASVVNSVVPPAGRECGRPIQIGELTLDPALRLLAGPLGTAQLEPRVMAVLLALVEASPTVLSREVLMARCWPKLFVAEDSLHRAVGEIRRALRTVSAGDVRVETIPKSGYRLLAAGGPSAPPATDPAAPPETMRPTRRWLLAGIAGAAGAGAAGAWLGRQRRDPRIVAVRHLLMQDPHNQRLPALSLAEAAAADAPRDAEAWGLLALVLATLRGEVQMAAGEPDWRSRADVAAARAFALQSDQVDARAALAIADGYFGRWVEAEAGIRSVVRDDPWHAEAGLFLSDLVADVGRLQAAEAVLSNLPAELRMFPAVTGRAARLKASMGDAAGAIATMAAARGWAQARRDHLRFALALGRADVGAVASLLAGMKADPQNRVFPPGVAPALLNLAAATLDRDATARQMALAQALEVAATRISAAMVIMRALPAFGEVDAAFAVADGLYRNRGPVRLPSTSPNGGTVLDYQRMREAAPLFQPGTAAMRADPRFLGLAEDIGLSDYWRRSGTRPDYLGARPLLR